MHDNNHFLLEKNANTFFYGRWGYWWVYKWGLSDYPHVAEPQSIKAF